jgi:hypothetical protein
MAVVHSLMALVVVSGLALDGCRKDAPLAARGEAEGTCTSAIWRQTTRQFCSL